MEFFASKVVFYECLNTVLLFKSDGYYYCSCDEFSGYKSYVGNRGYCFVCQIRANYSSNDFEKIKYQPDKLINLAFELFNGIRCMLWIWWNFVFFSEERLWIQMGRFFGIDRRNFMKRLWLFLVLKYTICQQHQSNMKMFFLKISTIVLVWRIQ